MRYILEGEWTGYTSSQRKICHREVISEKRAKRLIVRCIVFTDNTSLVISVRPAAYREKIGLMDSYGSLIREAEQTGKARVRVEDLPD